MVLKLGLPSFNLSTSFVVHAGGGVWGTLAVPIFSEDVGVIFQPARFSSQVLQYMVPHPKAQTALHGFIDSRIT